MLYFFCNTFNRSFNISFSARAIYEGNSNYIVKKPHTHTHTHTHHYSISKSVQVNCEFDRRSRIRFKDLLEVNWSVSPRSPSKSILIFAYLCLYLYHRLLYNTATLSNRQLLQYLCRIIKSSKKTFLNFQTVCPLRLTSTSFLLTGHEKTMYEESPQNAYGISIYCSNYVY